MMGANFVTVQPDPMTHPGFACLYAAPPPVKVPRPEDEALAAAEASMYYSPSAVEPVVELPQHLRPSFADPELASVAPEALEVGPPLVAPDGVSQLEPVEAAVEQTFDDVVLVLDSLDVQSPTYRDDLDAAAKPAVDMAANVYKRAVESLDEAPRTLFTLHAEETRQVPAGDLIEETVVIEPPTPTPGPLQLLRSWMTGDAAR